MNPVICLVFLLWPLPGILGTTAPEDAVSIELSTLLSSAGNEEVAAHQQATDQVSEETALGGDKAGYCAKKGKCCTTDTCLALKGMGIISYTAVQAFSIWCLEATSCPREGVIKDCPVVQYVPAFQAPLVLLMVGLAWPIDLYDYPVHRIGREFCYKVNVLMTALIFALGLPGWVSVATLEKLLEANLGFFLLLSLLDYTLLVYHRCRESSRAI